MSDRPIWRYSRRCLTTHLEVWLNTATGRYGWFIPGRDPNADTTEFTK